MKYNITKFGAVVSDALQTDKIQAAIDKCFKDGGGEVVIPEGVYRTGGLRLRSNVTLHLLSGAVLEGSENPEDYCGYINDTVEPLDVNEQGEIQRSVYPFNRWNNAIIRAIDAENISIIGEPYSYIDGVDCYDESGEEGFRGPHAINFQNCRNIVLKGYKIRRSANWAHAIFNSRNISMTNVTVYGGHDGFDVRTCDDVLVEDCEFYTGDDCIAGFDNHNVKVRNCLLNCSCNAVRFGGTDVLVENCKIWSPAHFGHRYWLSEEEKKLRITATEECNHNMLTVFCYYCDFRAKIRKTPGNIVMRNCVIENVRDVFNNEFGSRWCCNRELESFRMENCSINGVKTAIVQYGDAEGRNMVLEFENVEFTAADGSEDCPFIKAKYFKEISCKNVTVKNYNKPFVLRETEDKKTETVIENVSDFKITEEDIM